jgi:hypothetical protein
MASTIVVSVIGVIRNEPDNQARRAYRLAAFVILAMCKRHTNAEGIAEVTTTAGLTTLASPCRAKGASQTVREREEPGVGVLLAMSQESGKSVDWLLTGKKHVEPKKRVGEDRSQLG